MDWREFLEKNEKWDKNETNDNLGIGSSKKLSRKKWTIEDWNKEHEHDPDLKMDKDNRAAFDEWANTNNSNFKTEAHNIPRTRVGSHQSNPVTDEKGRGQDTKIGIQNRYLHSDGASDFGKHLQTDADEDNKKPKNMTGDIKSHLDRLVSTDASEQGHYEKLGTISPKNAEKWKSWLEKGKEIKKKPAAKPTMFPRIRREFVDDADDKDFKKSWESWLDKNNAIETSHKEGEKKEEWDGKFSSSTIRDDVKDDDKAVSEEESLEELTDGKLEEIEKLKSWEVFLVKINQFDKGTGRKRTIGGDGKTLDTDRGITPEPLTESGKVSNPKGSIDPNNKRVRRLNHETGKRESVFIKGKFSTNPETPTRGGGRPDSGKQGSVNTTAGGKSEVKEGAENNSILYNAILEQKKIDEKKQDATQTEDTTVISNDSTDPATPIVPETAEAKRRRLIQGTYRKERNTDGSIKQSNSTVTNWESWLEKGRWDTGKKENKFIDSLQAVGTMANEENNRSMKVIDDEIDHGIKPSNITSEPIKMPKKKVPSKDVDSRLNVLEAHKLKSWTTWLEKMQGAGDARYGNQHLTGLDQKPVNNEEDEANILPEKEEKTDNKEEKQEETDNKPYKALGGE